MFKPHVFSHKLFQAFEIETNSVIPLDAFLQGSPDKDSCDNAVCSLNGRFFRNREHYSPRPPPKKKRRTISCWQNDWFGDSRKAGPPFFKNGNNMTKNPIKSANGELWFGFTETAFTNQLQWATSHSESLCFSGSRVPHMSS